MIPIRCYSCGKPIAHLWDEFKESSDEPQKVLTKLGLHRFCCRQSFVSHVELIDTASRFKKF